MSRRPRPQLLRGSRVLAVTGLLVATLTVVLGAGSAHATLPRGDTVESDPAPTWGWEQVLFDGFDGAAGVAPEQWHAMLGSNGAAQNGLGQLDVGRLAQIRTNAGWTLPAGTQVRVTASLVMPDTGSNYAAFWAQHPNGTDPREVDVIESYGPLKPTGAQLGSHICYDEMVGTDSEACERAGMPPELWPVTQAFPVGALPWEAPWAYSAEFTIGGDTVLYAASDGDGNRAYDVASTPDPRRVPGNAAPFHLRLSNKDVAPEYAVPGGTRPSMLVDWVRVEVKYP